MKIRKPVLISTGIFSAVFLFSFLVFFVTGFFHERRFIFFPELNNQSVTGESRSVVKRRSAEDNLRFLVEEMILGPMELRHSRVLPEATQVSSVLIRDGVAYVDLTTEAIFLGDGVKVSFTESLEILRKTILFNFRFLDNLVVTVSGQIPEVPSYIPKLTKKKISG